MFSQKINLQYLKSFLDHIYRYINCSYVMFCPGLPEPKFSPGSDSGSDSASYSTVL